MQSEKRGRPVEPIINSAPLLIATTTDKKAVHIFGRKVDLIIFPITTVLGITLGLLVPQFSYGFFAYVFASELHSFTTAFFTFGSKPQMAKNRKRYSLYLFGGIIVFGIVQGAFGGSTATRLFVLTTIFHFARQQAAWFQIAVARGPSIGAFERAVNVASILAATWGFVLIYLSDPDQLGWFVPGDLWSLPSILFRPFTFLTFGLILIYPVFQLIRFLQNGFTPWSQHIIWACAVVGWGASLIFYVPYVVALMHSVPYLYLSLSYVHDRVENEEEFYLPKFNAKKMVYFVFLVSGAIAAAEWYSRALIFYIWAGIATSHYMTDGFFWKSKNGAEGRVFLDRFRFR